MSSLTFSGIAFGLVGCDVSEITHCLEASIQAVSPSAMKAMRKAIRDLNLRCQTQLSLQEIARMLNPLLRGWIAYYGRHAPTALYPVLRYVNQTLAVWARRKFKRFKDHTIRASKFLQRLATKQSDLFVHWDIGMNGAFA